MAAEGRFIWESNAELSKVFIQAKINTERPWPALVGCETQPQTSERAAASSPSSEDCLPSQRACREGAVKAAMEFLYMISNSLHFSVESDSCLHLLHSLYVIINVFYVRGYHSTNVRVCEIEMYTENTETIWHSVYIAYFFTETGFL